MTEEQEGQCSFQEPESLKDVLELLVKLNDASSLKDSVGQKLVEDVRMYFKDSDSDGLTSSLGNVFTTAQWIRSTILDSSERQYGKYGTLDRDHGSHASHKDCALKISNALKRFLPQGYAALYYLYFMCSTECSGIGGSQWNSYNVKDSGQKLYQWLTDNRLVTMPEFIKRGFSDGELDNHNDGSTVASVIKQIISHDSAKALQKVLASLLFVCPWDPSLLGHACLFLHKFCSMVGPDYTREGGGSFNKYREEFERKFNGSFDEMQKRCNEVNNNHLQTFLIGSDSKLSAVCSNNSGLFNDLWDDKYFEDYVKWLKENLKDIIGALQEMSSEPPGWSLSTIPHGFSAGPFRFGFVFKDDSWKDGTFKSGLSTSDLEESLRSLNECLGNISSGNSGSSGVTAGGAAGGVLGAGGLGFGAAYATNAFGLKDIISGLIASLIK